MPHFAECDSVSRVSGSVGFGEPRSGTTSLESGCVTAMFDFAGDINLEHGEPSLPSGVYLDMPLIVPLIVSHRCRIVGLSVNRSPGRFPWDLGI